MAGAIGFDERQRENVLLGHLESAGLYGNRSSPLAVVGVVRIDLYRSRHLLQRFVDRTRLTVKAR